MSIGETLATARQTAGLTISQVSERTRIRASVIRGIEADDFASCGGNFYARGHIRSIAKVVGIDPEPLIREFDRKYGALEPTSAAAAFESERPVKIAEPRSPNWTAAMAVALVLVVLYGIVRVLDGGATDPQTAQPVAQPSRAALPAQSATATPAPDAVAAVPRKNVQLRVKAKRSSWLNVRDEKGRQLFSGLLASGKSMEWTAKKRIYILIGNGGGVELTVNGRKLGSPGTDGQVLRLDFGPGDPEGT